MPRPAAPLRLIGNKIRLWGPPLVWMGLIFFFSSSSDPKQWFHWLWPASVGANPGAPWLDFIVFKTGHFFEYAVLGWLYLRALDGSALSSAPGPGDVRRGAFIALTAAVLYAITDEFHQSFVPGREAALRDVIIDAFGSGTAIAWRCASRPKTAR